MRADRIAAGELEGQPPIDTVVSIQEETDEGGNVVRTEISFHSGDVTIAKGKTDASYETDRFEHSTISRTKDGFKARVATRKPKGLGEIDSYDSIIVYGKLDSLKLRQEPTPDLPNQPADTPINLFVNGELVDTGMSLTWPKPLLERPAVQVGLGVVGVTVATGIIGKLLDWW